MAEHTPGPWMIHLHNHVDGELWLSIGHLRNGMETGPVTDITGKVSQVFRPCCEFKYLLASEDEQWANAHLIAAAPDLLAALEEVEYGQIVITREYGSMRECPICQNSEGYGHGKDCLISAAIAKARGES